MKRSPKFDRIEVKLEDGGELTFNFSPTGLLVYALQFLAAAKKASDVVVPSIPTRTVPFAPARTFLVCRALELAFKAFLALKGYRLDKLSGGLFGHDLKNLLVEAENQDLHDIIALEKSGRDEILRASKYC
jgi:hypothetical protein